jgi:hypothetical protein
MGGSIRPGLFFALPMNPGPVQISKFIKPASPGLALEPCNSERGNVIQNVAPVSQSLHKSRLFRLAWS